MPPTFDLAAVRERLSATSGKHYWRSLEELADDPGFREMLERESEALRPPRRQSTLRLSVLQSFASLWLLPRLAAFKHARPDLEVEIDTSTELMDLTSDRYDAAIRFGTGRWPGLVGLLNTGACL